jgi:outer membrane protein OmpA-like peptidoglycan-associated protein
MALVKQTSAQEQLSLKQQADKLYDRYEYFKSLNLYLKLADRRNVDIKVIERIADCYRNINQYEEAETWFSKALADAKADKTDYFYYAEVLLRDQKFDQAKEQYKIFFAREDAELAFKLAVCDSAAVWMKQPSRNKVTNTADLNTPYSDWGLNYDGKTGFIFTSDRIADDNTDNRTGNNWFKLYRKDIKNNSLNQLSLSNETNDKFDGEYHIGPMTLNKTGDTAYITVTTEASKKQIVSDRQNNKRSQKLFTRRLQLFIATKANGHWSIIGSFPYNNIQKYSVGGAALSNDGKAIYFASDMAGGEGKTDIWYCEKLTNGTWDKPINCGKNINTKEEEDFPYISDDGSLYYASKGLAGMGGYDIYKVTGKKNQWGTPENLKYPVNSTSDDFYLATRDGLSGYLSSNREGGQGSDDIYSFGPDRNYIVPTKPTKTPDTTKLNAGIPPDYAKGYNLTIIYYDLDKYNIRPDAAIELDKLAVLLKQHPTWKIELLAYTDARASDNYNLLLSKERAVSAVDYLVRAGVLSQRLLYTSYGKKNPVNQCADGVKCTEAEHQLNRRAEFKLISE